MTIGTSLFLIALGAIFKYAIEDSIDGVNLGTIGVILMIVGAVGLIISFLYMSMWNRDRGAADGTVVRERERVRDRF
jgi:uncharacterized protein DUF6458